jgi:hypothetical protein
MSRRITVATLDNNAVLGNAAFFSRTTPQPTQVVQTQAIVVSAAALSGTNSATSTTALIPGASYGGGSDRLAGDLDGAEPLPVMPASYPEDSQTPPNPAAPNEGSSAMAPIVPMSRKAVDGFFASPLPATEATEGSVPAPIPSEARAFPAAELNEGALGFVALLGGLWTVRVAREEEKRPALRR